MDKKFDGQSIYTILKITSVSVTPNPVRTGDTCQIDVVLEQEHYNAIPNGNFEFEFSNESLIENLINMGDLSFERTYDVPDIDLKYVQYKLAEGNFIDLTFSTATNSWYGTFIAPSVTSWFEEDHAYSIAIRAEDVENNSVKADRYDEELGKALQLRVLDKVFPVIETISPTELAYVTSSKPRIDFRAFDASPGIDPDSLTILIDDTVVQNDFVITEEKSGWWTIAAKSKQTIKNGAHTYKIRLSDYDGNQTISSSIAFTLDTTAGHGETFNMAEGSFEWFRFHKLVQSGVLPWMKFDLEWLFNWMLTTPEDGDHFFQKTDHHEDDEIVYKLQVEVKR